MVLMFIFEAGPRDKHAHILTQETSAQGEEDFGGIWDKLGGPQFKQCFRNTEGTSEKGGCVTIEATF